MADPDPDIAALEAASTRPQSASSDGNSVTAYPLKDRIDVIKFKRSQSATVDPGAMLRGMMVKNIPPGAT